MNKIGLIIEREYISRVKKRSFIILTFLTPLLMVLMILVPLWLSQIKSDDIQQVAVVDQTGLYPAVLTTFDNYRFVPLSSDVETLKKDRSIHAIVVISGKLSTTPNPVSIYSEKQVTMSLKEYVRRQLEEVAREEKLSAYGIENLRQMVDDSKVRINVATIKLGDDGAAKEGSSEMALMVGFATTFIIYMFIILYGAQVMQGVMQEKTNRIVEVMISSVKPFELMMGKIIGIALVGLTQFLLWVVLSGTILASIGLMFNLNLGASAVPLAGASAELPPSAVQGVLNVLMGINFKQLVLMFIVYFIGGYLLYASMFAAVGAAVDNETDTQQFMFPITIPLIFAMYAALYSAQNPDGPLAFWCSMIPFTSPVVMMVRLPYGVPSWEIVLSLSLLYLSFVGTTYVSARIYRVGILMYGKKPSWKELWKWMKIKN